NTQATSFITSLITTSIDSTGTHEKMNFVEVSKINGKDAIVSQGDIRLSEVEVVINEVIKEVA
ncbi:918_t:CDS:1, partial [Acaulospora colombiana]